MGLGKQSPGVTLVGPCQNRELNPVLSTTGMSREAPSCIVDICRRRSGQRSLHFLHIISGICPSRTPPGTPGMHLNTCRAVLQSPAESALVGFLPSVAVISDWDQVMPSPFWMRGSSPSFAPQQEPCWEPGRVRVDEQHPASPSPLTGPWCLPSPLWLDGTPDGCTGWPPEPALQGHLRPPRPPLSLCRLWLSLHTEHRLSAMLHRNQELELSRDLESTWKAPGNHGAQNPLLPARTAVIAPCYCQE